MIFYLIRHGDPIYEPDSLTELGHKQAAALSKRLAVYGLDEIYASSSIRAQMTAQPTCDLLGKEMKILDWAHEARTWEHAALPKEDGSYTWSFYMPEMVEQYNDPSMLALGREWYKHPCLANTKMKDGMQWLDKEVDTLLASLGYEHDREKGCYHIKEKNEKRIALFAHQGFGLAFLSSLLDIPYPLFCTRFDISHSGVTVIHFPNDREVVYPKILQLSNDSHLYKEDILTGYHNIFKI